MKTWKQKLNKKEVKHLTECGIKTKYDLERQKNFMLEERKKIITERIYCWECHTILRKLGMLEE